MLREGKRSMKTLYDFFAETPRAVLMPAPTPLHSLDGLAKELGYPQIYIKRDDMTGIGPGGNKIRSLEFILGEALKQERKVILASGPAQSNLCTLTAAACAKLGLVCELVHNGEEPEKKEGNLLLNDILGVRSHFLGNVDSEARDRYVESLYHEYEELGKKPYVVRNGATTGRGALGYTFAVLELMEQCNAKGLEGMTIFAPGGNGGVAAGLVYGNAVMGAPFHIIVISVEDDRETLLTHIETTLREAEMITGVPVKRPVDELCEIVDDYRGMGWGANTKESEEEIFRFARKEGIFIENVYTSKVMVGMKDWLKKGRITGPVCYLHTGGFGSLFAQY